MSAITRFVSNTFSELSQKRQMKRLVHDNATVPDCNPNFNYFDPAEHFGAETWQSTSGEEISPPKQAETPKPTANIAEQPNTKRGLPLKNMVKKLTPFNNNNKEIKDKNDDRSHSSTNKADDESKKTDKKSVWKFKDQIERKKIGDRQMLIEFESDSG